MDRSGRNNKQETYRTGITTKRSNEIQNKVLRCDAFMWESELHTARANDHGTSRASWLVQEGRGVAWRSGVCVCVCVCTDTNTIDDDDECKERTTKNTGTRLVCSFSSSMCMYLSERRTEWRVSAQNN